MKKNSHSLRIYQVLVQSKGVVIASVSEAILKKMRLLRHGVYPELTEGFLAATAFISLCTVKNRIGIMRSIIGVTGRSSVYYFASHLGNNPSPFSILDPGLVIPHSLAWEKR